VRSAHKDESIMTISNETLRKFAVRAVRSLSENKYAHPMIAAYEPALVPLAEKFNAAFDAHRNFTPTRVERMGSRHAQCSKLYRLMRQWSGALAVAIPSYDAHKLLGNPKNPDPVLDDALRLIKLLNEQGESFAQREHLIVELTARLAAATEERAVSLRTRTQNQTLEAELQPLRDDLLRILSLFRETLRDVLGKGHPDYQALRVHTRRKKNVDKVDAQSEDTDSNADPDTEKAA